jgi:hypothetical protein
VSRCEIYGVADAFFPAEAGPTNSNGAHPVGLASAGKASSVTLRKFMVLPMPSSRLKPVLLTAIACILWNRL